MVKFLLEIKNPRNHLIDIRMTIENPHHEGQLLSLPNWIPGSYMIRDFSKNIITMEAFAGNNKLAVKKLSKSSWQIEKHQGPITVEYSVFAYDLSVRSAHVDEQHAFFNGTSVFLKPELSVEQDYQVEINNITPDYSKNWKVKTSLPPVAVDDEGFGQYQITGYQELIDHPVEISDSIDVYFEAGNKPHSIHFTGDVYQKVDQERLAGDLTKICNEHIAMFENDFPPLEYKFLTMVSENGYGGLEHKSSTALLCAPDDLPFESTDSNKEKYIQFLGLCSHEYFHLWNVKRLKPGNFTDLDLQQEVYTELLWFFEGITSYYDDLGLLRSGCISLQDYLKLLAQTCTRLIQTPGRFKQTVTDSSFYAWTKFYKQDSNAANAIVSYYTKGAVVALGLDMTLREHSNGQVCLDDLMRHLWQHFGRDEKGIEESDVLSAIQSLTGNRETEFFERCLRSTEELPLQQWLSNIGIGLKSRAASNVQDLGGFIEIEKIDEKPANTALTLGLRLKKGSLEVFDVFHDSPAEKAGICPGDELLAVNNRKLSAQGFEDMIDQLDPEETSSLHLFRRDRLIETSVKPETKPLNVIDLYLIPDHELSDKQMNMRNYWSASSQK
jgi:predicted metalloprotease with PDZ domain